MSGKSSAKRQFWDTDCPENTVNDSIKRLRINSREPLDEQAVNVQPPLALPHPGLARAWHASQQAPHQRAQLFSSCSPAPTAIAPHGSPQAVHTNGGSLYTNGLCGAGIQQSFAGVHDPQHQNLHHHAQEQATSWAHDGQSHSTHQQTHNAEDGETRGHQSHDTSALHRRQQAQQQAQQQAHDHAQRHAHSHAQHYGQQPTQQTTPQLWNQQTYQQQSGQPYCHQQSAQEQYAQQRFAQQQYEQQQNPQQQYANQQHAQQQLAQQHHAQQYAQQQEQHAFEATSNVYARTNQLLHQLHQQRVAAGARRQWTEETVSDEDL